jgi:hypothetical protein
MSKHRTAYKVQAESSLASAQARVEKFAKTLVEDPSYALEWSDDVYLDGARVQLFKRILNGLEHPQCTLDAVVSTIESELMNMALYIYNRSTGQGKNRLQDCKVSVWAQELANVKAFRDREAKENA